MLPKRVVRILTAYVDGELSERQRAQVERLVAASAEAKEFLRQLDADAAALRRLPRRQLDEDLSHRIEEVLAAQSEAGDVVVCVGAVPSAQPLPVWARVAFAASVGLAAAFGAYAYWTSPESEQPPAVTAKSRESLRPRIRRPAAGGEPNAIARSTSVATPDRSPVPAATPEHLVSDDVTPGAKPGRVPAGAPVKPPDVLAAPNAKLESLEVVDARRAFQRSLRDLRHQPAKKELSQELRKAAAFRVELFAAGKGKAMRQVEAALQARGIGVIVDQMAQARLRVQGWQTDFVLYAEDLSADELQLLLEEIAAGGADEKGESARFAEVLVAPLSRADRRELVKLLGVDPSQVVPPRSGPLGVDIRAPLAKTTADELHKALSGQGPARPKPGTTSSAPGAFRNALLFSFNPMRSAANSPEIKRFLDTRVPSRPGTLQVFFVLRGVGG